MSDLYAIRGPVYSRKSTIGLSIPGGKFIFDMERGVHRAKVEWPEDLMETWSPPVDVSVLNHYRGDRVEGKREAWDGLGTCSTSKSGRSLPNLTANKSISQTREPES